MESGFDLGVVGAVNVRPSGQLRLGHGVTLLPDMEHRAIEPERRQAHRVVLDHDDAVLGEELQNRGKRVALPRHDRVP